MKSKLFFLFFLIFVNSLFIFSLPIQRVNAYGPNLEEGLDGFTIKKDENFTYRVIKNSSFFLNPYSIGDLLQYQITSVNNSMENSTNYLLPVPYFGDMIFAYLNYYNSTNSTWSYNMNNETLISTYNSTHSFTNVTLVGYWEEGAYYTFNIGTVGWLFGVPMAPFPLNFTAVNNTIINMSYSFFLYSPYPFFYSTPLNRVDGLWIMGTGFPTNSGSVKLEYTINDRGVVTRQRYFYNGVTDWELDYEIVLESKPVFDLTLLLIMLLNLPEDYTWFIIICVAIIIGLTLSIVLYRSREHVKLLIIRPY
jgi:hypothetical protein